MSNKARVKVGASSGEAGWKAFLGLVGTRLAAERKARGLTQQQVAEKLKASDQPSDMARWLEKELLALEDVDRVFVLEQAKGLIDHIKFRRERPAPKKLASSR